MLKNIRSGYLASAAVVIIAVVGSIGSVAKNPSSDAATAVYKPTESISYVIGSKRASGYFTRDRNSCALTMMIAEAIDVETTEPLTAARLRLALRPGETAGLDSEEGHLIALTCGADAETLAVRESAWDSSYRRVE